MKTGDVVTVRWRVDLYVHESRKAAVLWVNGETRTFAAVVEGIDYEARNAEGYRRYHVLPLGDWLPEYRVVEKRKGTVIHRTDSLDEAIEVCEKLFETFGPLYGEAVSHVIDRNGDTVFLIQYE